MISSVQYHHISYDDIIRLWSAGSKRPFPKSEPDVEPDFKEEPQYTTTHTAVPPKAKIKKPKKPAVAKVAEVIGSKDIFDGSETQKSSTATQKVSEEVLSKIQKALALGLHPGGHEAEKTHAMKRATRLMQQYGLSQAGAASTCLLQNHRISNSQRCSSRLATFSLPLLSLRFCLCVCLLF